MMFLSRAESSYLHQHLSVVRHVTLDPEGPGVLRIHLLPCKKARRNVPFVALLNGQDILPLSVSWAILLAGLMDALQPANNTQPSPACRTGGSACAQLRITSIADASCSSGRAGNRGCNSAHGALYPAGFSAMYTLGEDLQFVLDYLALLGRCQPDFSYLVLESALTFYDCSRTGTLSTKYHANYCEIWPKHFAKLNAACHAAACPAEDMRPLHRAELQVFAEGVADIMRRDPSPHRPSPETQ